MTLDKQKLIDAMALPIHEGHSCMTWEEAKRLAEASFAALQDYLPGTIDVNNPIHGFLVLRDLYIEIKTLGR